MVKTSKFVHLESENMDLGRSKGWMVELDGRVGWSSWMVELDD
jgi:hypothetical protein